MRPRSSGFTLIELLLALAILAAVLAIVLGGLRVGLAAWTRGEERTARLDRVRGMALLVEGALEGAFPYRVAPEEQREARILFEGRPDRLVFVTLSPPFPAEAPIAFTAVAFSHDETGLALRQQPLPNRLALDALAPLLVDRETSALRLRYLSEQPGSWQEEWSMTRERTLPRAVEVTLVSRTGGSRTAEMAFTVPVRAGGP